MDLRFIRELKINWRKKIPGSITVSNALEETSEVTTQEYEQQLYKFTTEFNPNDNLQTEYNLLYKTTNQNEISDLTTISGREGQRIPETNRTI